LEIWELACYEERTIILTSDANDFYDQGSHNVPGQRRCPAVLHTCQEAREEALKHYQSFEESTPWDRCMDDDETSERYPGNTIYINFAVDTIVLPICSAVSLPPAASISESIDKRE